MAWLRVDDGFVEHEKIVDLSDKAFRLHMAALCYCSRNLTDGRISARSLKVITAIVGGATRKAITDLINAGLWQQETDGSHTINDYLDWNPSAERVKAERARNAERQARHRNTVCNAVTNSVSNAAPSHPIPSQGLVPKEEPLPSNAARKEGSDESSTDTDFGTLRRLLALIPAKGREEARRKVIRTVQANHSSEADLIAAIEAAAGSNVRDPIAVILSTLKKRAAQKGAAA